MRIGKLQLFKKSFIFILGISIVYMLNAINTKANDDIIPVESRTYQHPELDYVVNIPDGWSVFLYPSNDYEGFYLYDEVAQNQDSRIPDLVQGAKIEISEHKYTGSLEDFNNSLSDSYLNDLKPEIIENIRNTELNIGNNAVPAVKYNVIMQQGSGVRTLFIKDSVLYSINLIIPNSSEIGEDNVNRYLSVYDDLVSSLRFKSK